MGLITDYSVDRVLVGISSKVAAQPKLGLFPKRDIRFDSANRSHPGSDGSPLKLVASKKLARRLIASKE